MLAILHRDRRFGTALARMIGQRGAQADVLAVQDLAADAGSLALPSGAVCIVDEGTARSSDDLAAFIRGRPGVRFVVIVASRLPHSTLYVDAGAVGIVEHDNALSTIAPAVTAVTAGFCAFPDQVLRRLLRHVHLSVQSGESSQRLSRLSPREYEIVEHLAAGSDPATIATTLQVTVNTVRSHLKSIFRKLGVHSSVEAVVLAISAGVTPEPRDQEMSGSAR